MKNILSVFKNLNIMDWILAIAFIILVSYAVYLVFPPYGWMFGLAAALLLLFIAKRRRDHLVEPNHQEKK